MLDHLIQDHDPTKPSYGAIADHPGTHQYQLQPLFTVKLVLKRRLITLQRYRL